MIDISEIELRRVNAVIKVNVPAGETRHMNNRSNSAVMLVEYGNLQYEHEGRRFLSDPGHVLLVPVDISYNILCTDKSLSRVINFEAALPAGMRTMESIPISRVEGYLAIADTMDTLLTFKKSAYRLRCLSALYDILARLETAQQSGYQPGSRYNILSVALRYMEQNYSDPALSNDVLADRAGISTVYFRKLFTEKYGMGPMKYVKTKRIEKAQELLKSHYFASVSDIAEEVGFCSIYSFSRAFKLATGYAPSEYALLYEAKAD